MKYEQTSALQLCPFSAHLESGLQARFDVVRWFELGGVAQEAYLSENGKRVRAVVTGGHVGCSSALMERLPSLGIIAINGVGTDKIDLDYARDRDVRVTTTPGAPSEDTADLAVGLIIALLRTIPAADAFVRAGQWPHGDFPLSRKVSGKRFGIVGLGQIGLAVAKRLAPFGPVAYTGPRPKPAPYTYHTDLLALAHASDVLVVSCPANGSTRHLIDLSVLQALGANGYVINVARGSVLDEQALIGALEIGGLAGAALDVFEDEPNVPDALRGNPKVLLSPHVASATVETRAAMAELVLDNLDAFMAGERLPTAVG